MNWRERLTGENVALIALVVVGVLVRLLNNLWSPVGLSGDEAIWAGKLLDQPVMELSIRPVGYMWLVKQLTTTFGLSEVTLRLPSIIAGVGVVLLAPFVARQVLESSLARVMAVALIVVHPALVDFSKEFKPYMWEGFLHLLLMAAVLFYRSSRRKGVAIAVFALAPVVFPLAYNIVFTFPGIFLVCFADAVKARHRAAIAGLVVSAVVTLGGIGYLYKTTLTRATSERSQKFWGGKYGIFYSEPKNEPRLSDLIDPMRSKVVYSVEKYAEVAALPGKVRGVKDFYAEPESRSVITKSTARELRGLDVLLWCGLHILGLVALLRQRRFDHALLVWLPVGVMTLFGIASVWPMGSFRTNTFVIPHVTLLGLVAVDGWLTADSSRRRRLGFGAMGLIVAFTLLPQVLFDPHPYTRKRWWTSNTFPAEVAWAMMDHEARLGLQLKPRTKRTVLFEPLGFPLKFYMARMPAFKEVYDEGFTKRVKVVWTRRASRDLPRYLRRGKPVWVLFSRPSYLKSREAGIEKGFEVLAKQRIRDQHVIMLVAGKKPRPSKAKRKRK